MRCPLSPLLFNSFGNPSHGSWQRRKKNKRNTSWLRSEIVTVCRGHHKNLQTINVGEGVEKMLMGM